MLTLTESLDDKGEVEESEKDDIEFVEAGEDATEAFESAEKPSISLRLRYRALS